MEEKYRVLYKGFSGGFNLSDQLEPGYVTNKFLSEIQMLARKDGFVK